MYFRYIFFPHLFTDQVGRIRSCEKKKPSFRLFLAFLLVRLFGTGYILGWTFAKKAAVCNRSLIPPFTHAIFSVTMCRLSWSPHLIQHRKKKGKYDTLPPSPLQTSLQCWRILGARNLVRVRNIVVAAIFDFMTVEDWGE